MSDAIRPATMEELTAREWKPRIGPFECRFARRPKMGPSRWRWAVTVSMVYGSGWLERQEQEYREGKR